MTQLPPSPAPPKFARTHVANQLPVIGWADLMARLETLRNAHDDDEMTKMRDEEKDI